MDWFPTWTLIVPPISEKFLNKYPGDVVDGLLIVRTDTQHGRIYPRFTTPLQYITPFGDYLI